MEQVLETRVNILEEMTKKLGQANSLTNEVVSGLITGISTIVRNQVKEEIVTRTEEIKADVVSTVETTVDNKVRTAVNARGLNQTEMTFLQKIRNKRLIELLGDPKSDRYILFLPFYQSMMQKGYRKKFNCDTYGSLDPTDFNDAVEYEKKFNITDDYFNWCIETLHKNYRNEEFPNNKKLHAYERFFGIR